MSLTLGGDTDAFGELVQRHKNAVFAAALAVLRDYHAAEDCAQDAFLDAYLSLRSLRERASVRGWLCGIARRKALNVFNRTRRYESLADYADTLPDNAAAPEARLLSQEARRGIRASFAALSEKNRSVAELYFLGGVNTPEIARRLGISLGTVTYRLSVARARLKGDLQEMHDETSPGFTKTVMEKVGKLKTYYNDHNNSLDGFADALRETEQLVQTLPEGNDKHAALATISTQKYFNVENTDEQYSRALEAVERAGDGEAMTFLLVGKYIDMANGGEKSETSLAFLSDVALPKVEAMKYPHGVGILKFWRGRVRLDLRDTDGAAADLEDAVRLINPEDVYNANAAAVLPALKLAAAHSADTPEKPFAGMSILGEGLQYKDGVLRFMSQPGFGDDGVLDVRTELSSLFYFASRFDNGIFFDLSMRVGETRAVDRTAEQYGVKSSLTLVSLSESVTVPAGTFTDVMLVRGTVNGSFMNYAFDAWYAPGAGLVCFAPQNNLRPGASTDERYELESYEIKGGEGYLPFAAGNVWRYVLPGLPDYVYQHNERRVVWTDGTAANFTAFSIYRLREGWRGAHLDADLRAKMVETAADNDRYDEAIDLMRDVVRENVSHESVLRANYAIDSLVRFREHRAQGRPSIRSLILTDYFEKQDGRVKPGGSGMQYIARLNPNERTLVEHRWRGSQVYMQHILLGCAWDDRWAEVGYAEDGTLPSGYTERFPTRGEVLDAGTVTVAAGTFERCVTLRVTCGELDADADYYFGETYRGHCGAREYTFSPGVGLIKIETRWGTALENTTELAEYRTAGGGAYYPLDVGNYWIYNNPCLAADDYLDRVTLIILSGTDGRYLYGLTQECFYLGDAPSYDAHLARLG